MPIYRELDSTLTGIGDRAFVARGVPHMPRKDRGQTRFHVRVDRSELHLFLRDLTGYSPVAVIENIFGEDYDQTH